MSERRAFDASRDLGINHVIARTAEASVPPPQMVEQFGKFPLANKKSSSEFQQEVQSDQITWYPVEIAQLAVAWCLLGIVCCAP
jgi:hypothetical protein